MKNQKKIEYQWRNHLKQTGTGIDRRDFFRILGGGILIFFQPWNSLILLALPAEQAQSSYKRL